MIANVSPGALSFEDTYNTLKYANRAKNIKTTPNRNVTNVHYHISNYTNIINNLKNEVTELKSQLIKKDGQHNIKIENLNTLNSEAQSHFDKCVIELVTICEKEYSTKKTILLKENELEHLQNSTNQLNQINVCKSDEIDLENNDIKIANDEKIESLKTFLELNRDKLFKYEKRREKMASHWYKKGLKDFYLDYLHNIQRNHQSKIIILESKMKEKISNIKLTNKDALIKELEMQLKLRDNVISKNGINAEDFEQGIIGLDKIKEEYASLPQLLPKVDESFNLGLINSSISHLNLPLINGVGGIHNVNNSNIMTTDGNLKDGNLKPNIIIGNQGNYTSNNGHSNQLSCPSSKVEPRKKTSNKFPLESSSSNNNLPTYNDCVSQNNQNSQFNQLNLNCIQKCKDDIKNLLENKSPSSNMRRNLSPNSRKNSNVPPNLVNINSNNANIPNNKKNHNTKGSIIKLASEKNIKERRDFSNIRLPTKKKEKDNLSDISIHSDRGERDPNNSYNKADRDNSVDSIKKKKIIQNVQNIRLNHYKERRADGNQNHSNISIGEHSQNANLNSLANNGNYLKNYNDKPDKLDMNKIEKDNFLNNKLEIPLIKKKDLNVFLYDREKFRNKSKKPFK